MNDLPIATLFMLMSVDGKISTGSTDDRDFDQDLPTVQGVSEGLPQYYELEKQTDYYSFNTGRVMAKVGWNDEKPDIKQLEVVFVIVDNQPHLTERGVANLLRRTSKLYIVTTNQQHPAHSMQSPNLEVIGYEGAVDLGDLFKKLKSFGAAKITIQSGGEMNAQLVRRNLIQFVSLVIAPVMVGGKSTSSLLDGESLQTLDDLKLLRPLKLVEVEKLKHSYLLLKYKVIDAV